MNLLRVQPHNKLVVLSKYLGDTRWRSWLRHRKVAGSISDWAKGIFHSGRTMIMGPSQPLTNMIVRVISWVKGGKGDRCEVLTTLPISCADNL